MSILALDLGEKRVGVAISRSGVLVEKLPRVEWRQQKKLLEKLRQICHQEQIKQLVIGLPLKNGYENKSAEKIKQQGKLIGRALNLPVVFEDESYSTISNDDSDSAVAILEQYLQLA